MRIRPSLTTAASASGVSFNSVPFRLPKSSSHHCRPRRVAAETGVDVAAVSGSGRGGAVTKSDVLAHAATGSRTERRNFRVETASGSSATG